MVSIQRAIKTRDAAPKLVWEVLADYCNFNEQTARSVCQEFCDDTGASLVPADAVALDYEENITIVSDCYNSDVGDDPFHHAFKIKKEELQDYVQCCSQINDVICTICCDQPSNPYKLTCECVFCLTCISNWITNYNARCPNCKLRLTVVNGDKTAYRKVGNINRNRNRNRQHKKIKLMVSQIDGKFKIHIVPDSIDTIHA